MKSRTLNFDLNLVPMIDVFSACICFLLLTVVWIQIGTMPVKQGIGRTETASPPAIVATMNADGSISFQHSVTKRQSVTRLSNLKDSVSQMKKHFPDTKTALLVPHSRSNYQDILNVIDELKSSGFKDIGVTPL